MRVKFIGGIDDGRLKDMGDELPTSQRIDHVTYTLAKSGEQLRNVDRYDYKLMWIDDVVDDQPIKRAAFVYRDLLKSKDLKMALPVLAIKALF